MYTFCPHAIALFERARPSLAHSSRIFTRRNRGMPELCVCSALRVCAFVWACMSHVASVSAYERLDVRRHTFRPVVLRDYGVDIVLPGWTHDDSLSFSAPTAHNPITHRNKLKPRMPAQRMHEPESVISVLAYVLVYARAPLKW